MAITQMPPIQIGISKIVEMLKLRMPFGLNIVAISTSLLADKVQIAIFWVSVHSK
jgi:hypothetical protein